MRYLMIFFAILVTDVSAQSLLAEPEHAWEVAASARNAAASIERGAGYGELLDVMSSKKLEVSGWPGKVFFGTGWAPLEEWGVWSLGDESRLTIRLDPDRRSDVLYIHGRYFHGEENTRLWVNGKLISEAPMDHLAVRLTPDIVAAGVLKLRLQHIDPLSPHDVDPTKGDLRKLKFGLTELGIR